ncbi:hypothetical protein F4703DRAFT_1793047 [Phycomyces blakesleeanus]
MDEATPFLVLTIKALIKTTEWNPELLRPLQGLVIKVYIIVPYIFLTELARDPFFGLNGCSNQPFFAKVFLSFVDRNTDSSGIIERISQCQAEVWPASLLSDQYLARYKNKTARAYPTLA